eukprot:TRINITY_DN12686_c0_g1_i1.p1 TRINITY_DN12686_c0_g1~~TRINITY_DN12686_c0_g1_i1.p1  ORF type:complete len:448 (-),score=130.43 TRINITY_DN12686_c0_g1_i1:330-1673(-)
MAAPTANLVPITRAFLSKFYVQHPFEPISEDVKKLQARLQGLEDELEKEWGKQGAADVTLASSLTITVPHKIDENLWRHREQIEEALDLLKNKKPAALDKADTPATKSGKEAVDKVAAELEDILGVISQFQKNTADKVAKMVASFMPQDFRGTLIQMQRERSETKRQLEVEELVKGGASISEKYQLLWRQQMERRKTLAALGNATGMFRVLVTYLAGVPQVLLDFVRQINDHNGPMEEQRERYGPPLYELTSFVNHIRIFVAAWWSVYDSTAGRSSEFEAVLQEATSLYISETKRFLSFIGNVFDKSPFLIEASEALALEPQKDVKDEFQERTIARGESFEVTLATEGEGTMIAWDFSVDGRRDVGFSVDYADQKKVKMPMLPYTRYESHQGHFFSLGAGSYTLKWDNSYSMIYSKVVKYKTEVVPPAESIAAADESLTREEKGDTS